MPGSDSCLCEGQEEAEERRTAWVSEHELPNAVASWKKEREAFFDNCEIVIRKVGSGFTARRERWIQFPGGDQRPLGVLDPQDVIAKAWTERSSEPTALSISNSSAAEVKRVIVWEGDLFLGKESRKLPLVDHWIYGLPIDFVLAILNELGRSGWEVLHASEDRGLFAGQTVGSEAYVTRARYLLVKA